MEKRRAERTKVLLGVQVGIRKKEFSGGETVNLKGTTVNISNTGACLVLNGPLPDTSEIDFHIEIPSRYQGLVKEGKSLKIKAQRVWTNAPLDKVYQYRHGINFLDAQDRHAFVINKILELERENLLKRSWDISHPETIFPTLPLSSKVLDNLQPSALSVDVTNMCNLRCKHCFWHVYKRELSGVTNEHVLDSVEDVLKKYPTITNITWYGGEPLISKETVALLERGLSFAKNNLIMTNGTFPIPDWHNNVHFGVSIDGTREIHNTLRGVIVYDRIKKNIFAALEKNIRVFVLFCINAVNIDCIPDFLAEWKPVGVEGIGFTTYTPIKNKPSYFVLNPERRDKVVSLLMKMKKKYGRLICNTEAMIELIRAKYGEELAGNCPMNAFNMRGKVYSLQMCNDGSIRVPCALGRDAEHLHCRTITKVALYAAKVLGDKESLFALLRMYHSKQKRIVRENKLLS